MHTNAKYNNFARFDTSKAISYSLFQTIYVCMWGFKKLSLNASNEHIFMDLPLTHYPPDTTYSESFHALCNWVTLF